MPLQRRQQRFEGTVRQGQGSLVNFMLLKRTQTLGLVNPLSFVAKEHSVTVKGNAHLMRVGITRMRRLWVYLRGGYASAQGCAHIA